MHSCLEHIDHAIDVYLDEYEEMPVLNELKDSNAKCHFCQQTAHYELERSGVKGTWE